MMMIFVMMTVFGMAMVGDRAVGMLHATVRQMGVIVMVLVDGKGGCRARAEQGLVFRT